MKVNNSWNGSSGKKTQHRHMTTIIHEDVGSIPGPAQRDLALP